jgi:hypothetical protein
MYHFEFVRILCTVDVRVRLVLRALGIKAQSLYFIFYNYPNTSSTSMDNLLDTVIDELQVFSETPEIHETCPNTYHKKRKSNTSKTIEVVEVPKITFENINLDAVFSMMQDIQRDIVSHRIDIDKVSKKVKDESIAVKEMKFDIQKHTDDTNFIISLHMLQKLS